MDAVDDQSAPAVTPTLLGRIQTRLFLLATVGVLLTFAVGPILPVTIDGIDTTGAANLGGTYAVAFFALAVVSVLGVVVWEPLYHLAQQFRWEKDWPTLLGLVTGINEGLATWFILTRFAPDTGVVMGPAGFATMFTVVWVGVFLFANGPMRVLFIRWRFRGGRIL